MFLVVLVPLVKDSKQCLRNFLDLALRVSVGLSSPAKPCLNPLWCAANRRNLPTIISLMFSSSLFSRLFSDSSLLLNPWATAFICIWSKNKITVLRSRQDVLNDRRLYMNHTFIRYLIENVSRGHEVNVAGSASLITMTDSMTVAAWHSTGPFYTCELRREQSGSEVTYKLQTDQSTVTHYTPEYKYSGHSYLLRKVAVFAQQWCLLKDQQPPV